jgi:hypothetical protein
MTNPLRQAIDDADQAAIIQEALGIKSDQVVSYCFPKEWPADREQRARYIGEWLKTAGVLSGLTTGHRRFAPPRLRRNTNGRFCNALHS